MSEKDEMTRFTLRLPGLLHTRIKEALAEQKKHFKISKNNFIVALLEAGLDANIRIGFIPKEEVQGPCQSREGRANPETLGQDHPLSSSG